MVINYIKININSGRSTVELYSNNSYVIFTDYNDIAPSGFIADHNYVYRKSN